jgi:hypothetical protein
MKEPVSSSNDLRPSPSAARREWSAMGRRALLLLAVLAAMHAPVWLAGKTVMPWTGIEQKEWAADAPRPLTRTALDTADTIFLLLPWDEYSLRCASQGEWPWWNPYQGLGHPHWENIVTTGLSPGMWLEAALPSGLKEFVWLGQWWVAGIFTMMLARALGLRWSGTTLTGVAVITASHFELYLTQRHMSGTAMWWPLALWGIECLCRSFRPDAGAVSCGAAQGSRSLGFCGTAVGTWGLLTGGNPSITLAGGCAVALYGLVRIPWRSNARSLVMCVGWLALAGLSGSLLAAPAWANFFPWLASCYNRKMDPISLAPGLQGHVVFAPRHLGTALLPFIYGQTMEYPFGRLPRWVWSGFGGWYAGVVAFLALVGAGRAGKHKSAVWLLLAFMSFGTIARSYGASWTDWVARLPLWSDVNFPRYVAFIPVFGLALLAGYGFDGLCTAAPPGSKPLRAGCRMRLAMAGTWLAFMGVMAWMTFHNLPQASAWHEQAATHWKHFFWLGLFWSIVPVLTLLWTVDVARGRQDEEPDVLAEARVLWPTGLSLALAAVIFAPWGYAPLTHSLLGAAGGILLVAATWCALRFRPDRWLAMGSSGDESSVDQSAGLPRIVVLVASLAAVAVLPLSVCLLGASGLPPKFDPIPRGGLMHALSQLQGANYARCWSMDGLPVPNQAMPSGVFSLNVIDGLITREEAGYTSKFIDPHCPPLWLAGNASFLRTPGETPVEVYLSKRPYYQFAAVRYVTSVAALPGLHPMLRDSSGMMLLEDTGALPRVRLVAPEIAALPPPDAVRQPLDPATGTAEIQSFGANEVRLRATNTKPCVLVLADAPKAGWTASVNGHAVPLQIAHGCFRAVNLPEPGTWQIEMQYRPPWWNMSWLLAGAGFLCFVAPLGWLRRCRRHGEDATASPAL